MSQSNSISNLLFTGYYREVYPELKAKLFIGTDIINLCTCYYSTGLIFMVGVGQSGINITLDFIKQRFRDDHQNKKDNNISTHYCDPYLFQKTMSVKPNCMFVDSTRYIPTLANLHLDPNNVLIAQNSIVTSSKAQSTNFANAYYGDGVELMDDYMNKLRQKFEKRDRIDCIQFIHALGGGTGSGLGTGMLERVKDEYPYVKLMSFPVFADPKHTHYSLWRRSVLDTVLGIDMLQRYCDIAFPVDNSCLKRISKHIHLKRYKQDDTLIPISYNRVCNDVIHDLSVLLTGFMNIHSYSAEMIQYPSLKWISCSKYPYSIYNEKNKIETGNRFYRVKTVHGYTQMTFHEDQCLAKQKTCSYGRNLSTIMFYQGFEKDNCEELDKSTLGSVFDRKIISFNSTEKRLGSKSITMFANCTRFKHNLEEVLKSYKCILQPPNEEIVNEYADVGMSMEDFKEAKEAVENLISDYKEHDLTFDESTQIRLSDKMYEFRPSLKSFRS